jgi:hypothetical protein
MATVVVNGGLGLVTSRLGSASAAVPDYVAWGTGAGTAAVADTTLFTEASEARTQGAITQQTTNTTSDTYQVVGTITVAGSGKTITNAGLFNASSSGTMLMKGDFTGIALDVGESIQFTMQVVFDQA